MDVLHRNRWILLPLILSLLLLPCLAHPGGTDAKGGHYDSSTRRYHYHHGYPAHQHTDGICPYDFDDQTGRNSGSPSVSSSPSNHSDPSSSFLFDSTGSTLIIAISLALLLLFIIIRGLTDPHPVKHKGLFSLLYIVFLVGIGFLGAIPSFNNDLGRSFPEQLASLWASIFWSLYAIIPIGSCLSGTFIFLYTKICKNPPMYSQRDNLLIFCLVFSYFLSIPFVYLFLSEKRTIPYTALTIVFVLYCLHNKYNSY